MTKPYLLAETNWKAVKSTDYELAILPWGATEAHNYHMPYATDNYQVNYIAEQAAERAWKAGAKVIVLPHIPFGVQSGQLDIKLCMNLNPSTQLAILKDVVDTLKRHDIKRFVILNGHGGNHFKTMIRELSVVDPAVFCCAVDWFKIGDQSQFFEAAGDHANEMETSVMLHIRPDLILPLSEAGEGAAKQYSIKAFRAGWATAQRQWSIVSKDTGVGNPRKASAAKGKRYLDYVIEEISAFFVELSKKEALFE
ncbi:MAG: creatininase family protein [Bacteroidota bacterium]